MTLPEFLRDISFCLVLLLTVPTCTNDKIQSPQPGWPRITGTTKPWTRWWWMGSSVDSSDMKAAMEAYSRAGLGGLEVTAIYGVHGYENRFIKFLSPEWMKNFDYTLEEGKRLDLGIDLDMASGWPFGGLWVTPGDACKYMKILTYTLHGGEQLREKVFCRQEPLLRSMSRKNLAFFQLKHPVSANEDSLQAWALEQVRYPIPMPLQTLMAYSSKGAILDLTGNVGADGTLNWTAPAGEWKLYAVFEGWHGKMVERASPGAEGDVIDHFSAQAIGHYLGHFSEAFKGHDLSGMRACFNDSYEVDDAEGQSDFTPTLFEEFRQRRGYDLRRYLPALMGEDTEETNRRVLCDYRQTISDLILENFTLRWHAWAAANGKIIRNQAHGSPASILDLYAASDIPETESQDIVKIKSAPSAAHVTGKKLASSEFTTWLKEHFEASLADVKQAADLAWLGGVNHLFYHGTTFSPQDAPWPGWMFYAAVHFGPTNTFWNDFGTLNAYIARTQSFLQAGNPDNDILLYYPVWDEYAVRGPALLLHFDGSATGSTLRKTAGTLLAKGYAFDYISDRQIAGLETRSGKILTGGVSYQTLLLPPLKLIPAETLEKIITLAQNGATILMEQLPGDVPGLGDLDRQQAKLRELIKSLNFKADGSIQRAETGKGQILLGSLTGLLARANIRYEPMTGRGLQCIRRVDGNTTTYFIANRGQEAVDGLVPIAAKAGSAVLYNPMTGAFGKALVQPGGHTSQVYLQLEPGESCLVQVFPGNVRLPGYTYLKASGKKESLGPDWTLTFTNGGPAIPPPVKLQQLGSWTALEGDCYKTFSGTAVYKTTFQKPSGNAPYWQLSLGTVDYSARVKLNGNELGALIGPVYAVNINAAGLRDQNTLEISVANLMGNRIAGMDRKGQKYRIFYNTNFPAHLAANRGPDGLFSAARWTPQPSGLIGPVTLQPMNKIPNP